MEGVLGGDSEIHFGHTKSPENAYSGCKCHLVLDFTLWSPWNPG